MQLLITRDWSLMFCEDLHRVNTEEMQREIGWKYSEMIFEGTEGIVRVYCSKEEQDFGLAKAVMRKISEDPSWVKRQDERIRRDFAVLREALKHTTTAVLRELSEMNVRSHVYYAIMIWVPVAMERMGMSEKYREFIESAVNTRKEIQDVKPEVDEAYVRIAGEILRAQGAKEAYAKYVSFSEAFAALERGIAIDEGVLSRRMKGFTVTNEGILEKIVEKRSLKEGCELKGIGVSPGRAKGPAKIILTRDTFGEVEKGDVLVANMTTPDYLPVLKKVCAIVTDEGGITSHAAILGRELGVPCVIGTKSATKLFENGNIIEVDADKGIVKKE